MTMFGIQTFKFLSLNILNSICDNRLWVLWSLNVNVVVTECKCCGVLGVVVTERECWGHWMWVFWSSSVGCCGHWTWVLRSLNVSVVVTECVLWSLNVSVVVTERVLRSLNVSVEVTECECCGHRALDVVVTEPECCGHWTWVSRSLNASAVATERECCGHWMWVLWSLNVSAAVNRTMRSVCPCLPQLNTLMQSRSTFYMMREISAQFGLHTGNIKFNTNKQWINTHVIVHIVVIVCFFYTSCAIKSILMAIGDICRRNAIHNRG